MLEIREWRVYIQELKTEILAITLALKHPKTPWHCKLLIMIVVGYALSPIDLIPDFIPILGLLDDLILLPIGLWLVKATIPKDVVIESRAKAANNPLKLKNNWIAAIMIMLFWITIFMWLGVIIFKIVF